MFFQNLILLSLLYGELFTFHYASTPEEELCKGYTRIINVNESSLSKISGCQQHGNKTTCVSLDDALDLPLNETCMVLMGDATLRTLKRLEYVRNLKITSEKKSTHINCNQSSPESLSNVGIRFFNCTDIRLSTLKIKECGASVSLQTSQHQSVNETLVTSVAFVNCINVHIQYSTFTYSYGYSVTFLDTSGSLENVFIFGSKPVSSGSNEFRCSSGGGTFVQFSDRTPGLEVSIIDTMLTTINYNQVNESDANLRRTCRRGSGMAIYFMGGAKHNNVSIVGKDTRISSNEAKYGAGLYIAFEKNAFENNVVVINASLYQNVATGTGFGGAICIFDNSEMPNKVLLKNCNLASNEASVGGGVFVMRHSVDTIYFNDKDKTFTSSINFEIISSTFKENYAFVGAALYLQNINATFQSLQLLKSNSQKSLTIASGQGSLYALKCHLLFSGKSRFNENNNSALILDSSQLDLLHDGEIEFTGNKGYNGGAIAFFEHSQLKLSNYAKMLLQNNIAYNKGGAFYVLTPGPAVMPLKSTELSFYKCFIDFDNSTYRDFQGNLTFIDNFSRNDESNHIFTSSLQSCCHPNEHFTDIFTAWSNFHFISTAAGVSVSTHAVNMSQLNVLQWSPYPGEIFNVSIFLHDERGNLVSGSVSVDIESQSNVNLKSNTAFFVERNQPISLSLKGSYDSAFDPVVTTTTGVPLRRCLTNQTFQRCPFGFTLNARNGECQCDVVNNLQRGIGECSSDHIYLLPNRWVDTRETQSFVCPAGYCSDYKKCKPYCKYRKGRQCRGKRNETSRLCSRCNSPYSDIIGSSDCYDCRHKHTYIAIIIITFLGLSLFILIVMLLNLDIMSYNINIALFSYQIIDILYALDQQTDKFLDFFVSIFQFTDRNTAYPAYCLWDGLNPMQKCAYDSVVPASMMVIMFILYHCHFKWFHRIVWLDRWYQALSVVSMMCFADLFRISFQLLAPIYIDDRWYLYIYADASYFGKEHLPYGIVSLIVLTLILTVLIIFVIIVFKEEYRLGPTLNWISRLKKKICEYIRDDMHWFWVFYIFCRIVVYAVGIFMKKDQIQNSILAIFCFVVTLCVAALQPYIDSERNWIESLVLLSVTFISIFTLGMELVYEQAQRYAYSKIVHGLSYVPLIAIIYSLLSPVVAYRKLKQNRRKQFQQRAGSSTGPMRVWENSNFTSGYSEYKDNPKEQHEKEETSDDQR